jgi:hypothetical protein
MGSPPASLESQRAQRRFSFNFLLKGQKAKKHAIRTTVLRANFIPSFSGIYFHLRRIFLYVCRPLNGKHK